MLFFSKFIVLKQLNKHAHFLLYHVNVFQNFCIGNLSVISFYLYTYYLQLNNTLYYNCIPFYVLFVVLPRVNYCFDFSFFLVSYVSIITYTSTSRSINLLSIYSNRSSKLLIFPRGTSFLVFSVLCSPVCGDLPLACYTIIDKGIYFMFQKFSCPLSSIGFPDSGSQALLFLVSFVLAFFLSFFFSSINRLTASQEKITWKVNFLSLCIFKNAFTPCSSFLGSLTRYKILCGNDFISEI